MNVLRIRDVRLLVGAVGLSALGDMLLWLPLSLHIEHTTGSAFAVSAFFLALWGPVVALSGVAGVVVDRFENRRLLIWVSVFQAAVVAGLVFADSLGAILALTALLGAGVAISQPAEFALIPSAAGEPGRVAAVNGHVEAARYVGMTAGPLLGGVLAAAGALELALAIDALTFAAVAAAAVALRARREPTPETHMKARARDGFVLLTRDRDLTLVLAAAVAALAFFSISVTAELFFVVHVLDAGGLGYGALGAVWMGGMVAGAVVLARRVPVRWLVIGSLVAIAFQGIGIAGAATAAVLWVALIGFGLGGAAHGLKNVLLRTLIHGRVPEAAHGRAFAAYNGARNGAELAALAAGAVLVGALGARTALMIAGLAPIAVALVALLLIRVPRDDSTTTRSTVNAYVQG